MNAVFQNHANFVSFKEGDISIDCRLYDSADEACNSPFHVSDIADYIIEMKANIAICSIYNIERYITSEDLHEIVPYRMLLNQVFDAVRKLYENVIFITRISCSNQYAYEFCEANGFANYNFVSNLEESDPFLLKDNEISNKIWDYMVEHHKKNSDS